MAIHRTLGRRARALSVLSICATLTMFVAGCGTTSGAKVGPGVDTAKHTINLGILTPLTGPVAAPIGLPLTKGIEVFFKSVNASGGIDGYQINLVEKDSQYDPTMQVNQYNAIHNNVLMLAESLGSPTTKAIVNLATRDKMLVSAATLDAYLAREQYMILVGTPYRLQVENAFDYVTNSAGGAGAKVGLIYQDDAYGQDGLAGYQEAMGCYNLHDVAKATYELTDTSFVAQVSQMKAAGAQYVFLTAIPTAAATIIGTAAQLNYFPHWIMQSPAFATGLLSVSPQFTGLLEQTTWVVGQGALWGDTSQPGMKQMMQDIQQFDPGQQPDGYFEFGYTEAKVTYAILKRAADNGDLTRDGLLKAFNSLNTVDLGGLLPSVSYGSSPNQRVPSRDNRLFGIDHTAVGDIKPISGDFIGSCAFKSNF